VLSSKEDNTHAANAQSSSVAQTSPVIEFFSGFNQTLPTCLCYFDVYIKAGIICTEKQKPQHEQAHDARAVLSFKWQSKSGQKNSWINNHWGSLFHAKRILLA